MEFPLTSGDAISQRVLEPEQRKLDPMSNKTAGTIFGTPEVEYSQLLTLTLRPEHSDGSLYRYE